MKFREFIDLLDEKGYLRKIDHCVNWKYEIGQIARSCKSRPLLFENISDYHGCRLFTGGLSRIEFMAINMGMKLPVSRNILAKQIVARLRNPIVPLHSSNCFQNYTKKTKNINLNELPVPWWNQLDGGRYIGTWHLNITHDPFTGKRNAGIYRMQIIDKNLTTVSVSSNSHLAKHFNNAEKMGRDLEMAVAIGVDEVQIIAAAAAVPYGYDEFSFAGALQQKPVMLQHCEMVNIEVPIESEYVLEGKIKKGVRVKDGPFMDYSGRPGVNPAAYLFEVNGVFIRKDAIFRGMAVGEPGAEDHLLFSLLSSSDLVDFHGSSARQLVQNIFLKHRMFSLFQFSARMGSLIGCCSRSVNKAFPMETNKKTGEMK